MLILGVTIGPNPMTLPNINAQIIIKIIDEFLSSQLLLI